MQVPFAHRRVQSTSTVAAANTRRTVRISECEKSLDIFRISSVVSCVLPWALFQRTFDAVVSELANPCGQPLPIFSLILCSFVKHTKTDETFQSLGTPISGLICTEFIICLKVGQMVQPFATLSSGCWSRTCLSWFSVSESNPCVTSPFRFGRQVRGGFHTWGALHVVSTYVLRC